MSTMNGNPHYEVSEQMINAADGLPEPDADWQAGVATLASLQQATLALAFEQRTANLIAAHRLLWEQGLGHYVEAEKQIVARLGLNGDQS